MNIIYTFLITSVVVFVIDIIWLGVVAKSFYMKMLNPLFEIQFYWPAVFAFYFLFLIGLFIFAIMPGIEAKSLYKTLTLAAMFGFFCYMTYDLTNLATIKNFPINLVIVDLIWGTLLSTVTAFVAYKVYFFLNQ